MKSVLITARLKTFIENKKARNIMQKIMKYWDIKQYQKQIQDCADDDIVIGLGYLISGDQFKIGDTDYIKTPNAIEAIEKSMAKVNIIKIFSDPNYLVVNLSDFIKLKSIEMDDLIINTLIAQQEQIKDYENKFVRIKDVAHILETNIELHDDKAFSDKEAVKAFKLNCLDLCEILK